MGNMRSVKIYYYLDLNFYELWYKLAGNNPSNSLKYPKLGLMYTSVHRPVNVGKMADYIIGKYYPLEKEHKATLDHLQRSYNQLLSNGRNYDVTIHILGPGEKTII